MWALPAVLPRRLHQAAARAARRRLRLLRAAAVRAAAVALADRAELEAPGEVEAPGEAVDRPLRHASSFTMQTITT